VGVASQRIEVALAQLSQARVLWLPTVYLGSDYARHDGQVQDVAGNVTGTSKSSLMLGAGPYAVFALSDALLAPLAARQELRAREATLQAARNDSMLAVAEAYFNVQQARAELAGAEDVSQRATEVLRRAQEYQKSLLPEVEVVRVRAETNRRRQVVQLARERWRVASADLTRLLRLETSAEVEPLEPAHLRVTLVRQDQPLNELIALALTNRPELASQQALVQATVERLRQEKLRPLIPSVLLRGFSTPVTGTLAGGWFGGGVNDNLSNFSARSDFDLQVLWELRNLGFGNRALVQQRRAENQLALLEQLRTQDRVATEVAQAYAQAQSAAARFAEVEAELKDALDSANKNLQGMGQTRSAGNVLILVIRPQEVIAAVQTLAQAYTDFYAAIGDYNRAQFRLYHALGHPAQAVAADGLTGHPPLANNAARAVFGTPIPCN
jgi:outer membrane protein TolC